MPRPEDRWGDIVSPLMVSDNLDWIVCCIKVILLQLISDKWGKEGEGEASPRKVKRFCHSLGKRRRTFDVSFLHIEFSNDVRSAITRKV